jgi:hypothetical protein
MTERPGFDSDYVKGELQKLVPKIRSKIAVYTAGGAAMALMDLKESTKDIDVVVETETDEKTLVSALREIGYAEPGETPTIVYQRMLARDIVENSEGFRWDVFERIVAGKLQLSKAMIERSQGYMSIGNLSLSLLSKEDIFLMKGVTERERDLEDMRLLAESGLQWGEIESECLSQTESSGRAWADSLCNRLQMLRNRYKIRSSIEKRICDLGDQLVLEQGIVLALRHGSVTRKEIAKEIDQSQRVVADAISNIMRKGIVAENRSKRPFRYSLKD